MHSSNPSDAHDEKGPAAAAPADAAQAWEPFDRRHDLDALRAFAMLLGIGLHAALAYVTFPFWPVHDSRNHFTFDIFFSSVHGFRMPLFFMISGFFTAMLWRKRGLQSLIQHRTKRILLPLLIFLVTITPLTTMTIKWVTQAPGSSAGESATAPQGDPENPKNIWEAAKYNNVDALRGFLENADDLNRPDPQFRLRPLHWAALNGSTDAAKLMIEAEAEIDAKIDDGSTPLTHAAFTGRPEIVALLIENGADPNPVNVHQATPLDSTNSDWGTVQWVAGFLGLKIDRGSVEAGRKEARAILRENGGKLKSELDRGDGSSPGAGGGAKQEGEKKQQANRRGITDAYKDLLSWPGFWKIQIFGHLWFLWFLCILIVPFILYARIAVRSKWAGPPRWLFRFPLVLLWIVPLTMIPQWFNGLMIPTFGPDTAIGLIPPPHIILLYAVFFFFGVFYFDCDDKKGKLGRFWWLALPIALFVVYPAGIALTYEPDNTSVREWVSTEMARPLAVLAQALFAWLMIFGLIGLFRKICSRESKVLRYVSDSSYWLYVAHLPLIFLAQYLVRPLEAPAFVKFTIVCVAVTGFLLLTYEFLVRYSWLGTLLNGKRKRVSKQKTPAI